MITFWFFLLKASASAILGQSTNAWFKKTKVGIWFYAKVDAFYTWAAKRYDIEIFSFNKYSLSKEFLAISIACRSGFHRRNFLNSYGTTFIENITPEVKKSGLESKGIKFLKYSNFSR